MHRRRFLLGATMAVSTLAGCLGGESGGSNNSSNENGGGSERLGIARRADQQFVGEYGEHGGFRR